MVVFTSYFNKEMLQFLPDKIETKLFCSVNLNNIESLYLEQFTVPNYIKPVYGEDPKVAEERKCTGYGKVLIGVSTSGRHYAFGSEIHVSDDELDEVYINFVEEYRQLLTKAMGYTRSGSVICFENFRQEVKSRRDVLSIIKELEGLGEARAYYVNSFEGSNYYDKYRQADKSTLKNYDLKEKSLMAKKVKLYETFAIEYTD